MRWLADFVRAGITGVMWMIVGVISIVILVGSFQSGALFAMLAGIMFLGVMILVAMVLTIGIWRMALKWQGTGTPAQVDLKDPAFDSVKEKRDTAHLMEQLVDNMDDDELVELETLLLTREDKNFQ